MFFSSCIGVGSCLYIPSVSFGLGTSNQSPIKTILIFDNINNNINPNNYSRPTKPKRYRTGIDLIPKLNASGSEQPNVSDLKYIINEAKQYTTNHSSKEIFIVDLRQEPHVMINEYAVSWYGFKNQVPNNLEHELTSKLLQEKTIRIYKGLDKLPDGYFIPKGYSIIEPKNIFTEQFIVEQLGANYLRILVTDHFAPETSQVDLFVKFVKNLPNNSWLHFHCRGGRGRTTTFMAMYDIIQNSKVLNLNDILKRQYKLGGVKLSKVNFTLTRKKWKEPAAKDRYSFMKKFYDYVLDPNGYNKSDWSDWIKDH